MINVVLLREPTYRFDEGRAIVSNDLVNSSPAAEDGLQEPTPNGLSRFPREHGELREVRDRTATLNDGDETSRLRELHDIGVEL